MIAPAPAPAGVADASATVETGVRHAKLLHAAQQFEAVMLGELMKPLGSSGAIGSDDEGGGQGGALKSFGVEAMAGALAKSGALGFANRIVSSVEHHEKNLGKQAAIPPKVAHEYADDPRGGN